MAGWILLEAMTGSSYNALNGQLRLGRAVSDYPVLAATGWGRVQARHDQIEVRCLGGSISVAEIQITADPGTSSAAKMTTVAVGSRPVNRVPRPRGQRYPAN